jgi:hypothetical protein
MQDAARLRIGRALLNENANKIRWAIHNRKAKSIQIKRGAASGRLA